MHFIQCQKSTDFFRKRKEDDEIQDLSFMICQTYVRCKHFLKNDYRRVKNTSEKILLLMSMTKKLSQMIRQVRW